MLKILVTGVNGFVGHHLVRELHGRGYKVVGMGYGGEVQPDIGALLEDYILCDLTSEEAVAELPLEDINAVINLAGLAKIGASFDDAEFYKRVNVSVLTNLAKRLKELESSARIVAVSTGAVYDSNQPMPLTEKSKTTPKSSPYAESKLLMEEAAKDLRKKGQDIVIVRPFNHIGPGQGPGFLVPDLITKLKALGPDGGSLKVGNLKTKRDYTDVRDIAKAYADLAVSETLDNDTYNICSGKSHAGQEIVDALIKEMNLEGKVEITVDQSLIRPTDPPDLYGSNNRLREETGWEPSIPLATTLHDSV